MNRPKSLTHEQAIAYLHHSPTALEAWQRTLLDTHLESCASCRAYAGQVAALAPRLTQAMQARWGRPDAPPVALIPSVGEPGRVQTLNRRTLMHKQFVQFTGAAALVALLVFVVVGAIRWGLPASTFPEGTPSPITTQEATLTPGPLPMGLIAYSGEEGLTLMDFDGQKQFNLPQAYQPVWSPDGQRLAFHGSIYPEGEGPASYEDIGTKFPASELWVVNVDGSGMLQLTHSQPNEEWWDTAWSPDGRWLAAIHSTFERIEQDGRQGIGRPPAGIYLIRADGSGQMLPLPVETTLDATLAWSPDGRFLVFANNAAELVALDVNDLSARILANGAVADANRTLAWSPDGRTLAYLWSDGDFQANRVELRLLDAAVLYGGESAERTVLTLEHDAHSLLVLNVGELAWSPDGRRLSFISTDSGNAVLNVVNADGSGRAALTEIEAATSSGAPEGERFGIWQSHWTPNWSPDGQWLLYAALYSGEETIPIYRLDVDRALRGEAQPVLLAAGMAPRWQPLGGKLIPPIDVPLHSAPLATLPVTPLPSTPVPALNQRSVFTQTITTFPNTIAPGEAIAYVSYAGEHTELFVLDAGNGQASLLATAADARLASPTWSPDGRHLAFFAHSTRSSEEDIANLYSLSADGSALLLLTPGQPFYLFGETPLLAWSPDGAWLAAVSGPPGRLIHNPDGSLSLERDGELVLYLLKADGSGERRLVGEVANWASVAWSPDGKALAYVDNEMELKLSLVDGREITPHLVVSEWAGRGQLAWSPDGSQIAYFSRSDEDLYALKRFDAQPVLQGGVVQETTLMEWHRQTDSLYSFGDLAWSPDGTRLLFTSVVDGAKRLNWMRADGNEFAGLVALGEDPSSPEAVPSHEFFWREEWRPGWSPDGRWIVYAGADSALYKLDVQQAAAGQVVPGFLTWAAGNAQWQPLPGELIPPLDVRIPPAPAPTTAREVIFATEVPPLVERKPFTQTMTTFPNEIPEGQALAFSARPGERSEIFVMPVDGGDALPLAQAGDADLLAPTWAPDGSRLAFFAHSTRYNEEDMSNLYALDRNGANLTLLTPDQPLFLAMAPAMLAWSPDGQWLAVMGAERGTITHAADGSVSAIQSAGGNSLYVIKADGSGERRAWGDSIIGSAVWSPDGKALAFVDQQLELVLVSVADGRRISPGLALNTWAGRGLLAWSPDGRQIAYFSRWGEQGQDHYALKRFDAQAALQGAPLQETVVMASQVEQAHFYRLFGDLSWSPDGSRLLFTSTVEGVARLSWINADGSGYADLVELGRNDTPDENGERYISWNEAWRPGWSPDGRWIVYSAGDGALYKLDVQQALAGQVTPVELTGQGSYPHWQPGPRP